MLEMTIRTMTIVGSAVEKGTIDIFKYSRLRQHFLLYCFYYSIELVLFAKFSESIFDMK